MLVTDIKRALSTPRQYTYTMSVHFAAFEYAPKNLTNTRANVGIPFNVLNTGDTPQKQIDNRQWVSELLVFFQTAGVAQNSS